MHRRRCGLEMLKQRQQPGSPITLGKMELAVRPYATISISVPTETGSTPTGSPPSCRLRELQANGVTRYQTIARELDRRRLRTPRGGECSGVQVRSIISGWRRCRDHRRAPPVVAGGLHLGSRRQVRGTPILDCVVGIGEPVGAAASHGVDKAAACAGGATALQLSLSTQPWSLSWCGYASTAISAHSSSAPTMRPARAFQERMPTMTARIAGVTNRSASTAAAR